jgi:hypothetical protein
MPINGRTPIPPTQRELSISQHTPSYSQEGNPNLSAELNNRALQTSFADDDTKPFSVSIQDIDEAIFYYVNNVIKPFTVQNGQRIPVPLLYGDSEKWNNVQKLGFLRDLKGDIMAPLILFKRNTIEKNRSIANKLDANHPNNYQVFTKKYTQKEIYDNFKVLNNRAPVKTYYAVIMPDYVTINYSFVVFTYYVEQMNKIVEAIEYASDAYWGNPERYKFRAMIDSFGFQTELQENDERLVRSTFDLKLNGYIIPDTIQKDMNAVKKYSEGAKVIFSIEATNNEAIFEGKVDATRIVTEDPNAKRALNRTTSVG